MSKTPQLKGELFGHPFGLFILFFTEMWERFSYYGMRALLVLFLVTDVTAGGWGWPRAEALQLYALYTGLVYVSPIFGGLLADKVLGFRRAVVLGAFLMTCGHASMAMDTKFFFYLGLTLLILGNGAFKPNISSIVGNLYSRDSDRKDSAYTIFYMGINAGAFLGILLCGYLGEKVGWSYGFGLAGIFMFLGMLMFYFGQKIFGKIGLNPQEDTHDLNDVLEHVKQETLEKKQLLKEFDESEVQESISSQIGNAPEEEKKNVLQHLRDKFVKAVETDRLLVIGLFAFFTIFFWMAFEQAGGSMTIFSKDYTQRILTGNAATVFKLVNTILTLAPLVIVSYVLILLVRGTFKSIGLSNMFITTSFVIIWGIALWMLNKEYHMKAYEVQYSFVQKQEFSDTLMLKDHLSKMELAQMLQGDVRFDKGISGIQRYAAEQVGDSTKYTINGAYSINATDTATLLTDIPLSDNQKVTAVQSGDELKYLSEDEAKNYSSTVSGTVIKERTNETEVPASWFGILNSFFIIVFAPIFSRLWETKFNPPGAIKFAMGLILLGIGFGVLAYGGMHIPKGANTASVSMVWLILAYLFHTLGELCLSPVGLSYVSKLAPVKLVGLMFGVWFAASAVANYLAGFTGSFIDKISGTYSISIFFLIYFFLSITAGIIMILLAKPIKRMMHGIH